MKAIVTIYDDDDTRQFSKRIFDVADEGYIREVSADVEAFLFDSYFELEEGEE